MNRTFVLSLSGLALLAVVGCGHRQTIVTPGGTVQVDKHIGGAETVKIQGKDGTMTVDKGSNTMTVTSKDGTVTTGAQVDVEKATGVPAYPGSTQEGSMTNTAGGGSAMVALKTTDTVDKVADFYKKALPQAEVSNINGGGSSTVMLQATKDGRKLLVVVAGKESEKLTHVQITSAPK